MSHFISIQFSLTQHYKLAYCAFLFCGLTIFLVSTTTQASQYSDGMEAYLNGDYDQAQTHWLKAADALDAKSMFNLGLLHERGQIADANVSKAQSWFRLAGKNGYAAADYHLALSLLDKAAPLPEVKELLERSSLNGYRLAQQKLLQLNGQRGARSTHSQSLVNKQHRNNLNYQTEVWLQRQARESWTIQVLVFNDELNVRTFIDDHELKRKAAYYTEKVNDQMLYKLVYGVYDSKDKADFARQNLSDELKQHGPWLRSIESVQQAIKN